MVNSHRRPSSRAGLGVRRGDGQVWVALADAIPHPGSLLGWVLMAPADPEARATDGLAVERAEWVPLHELPSLDSWSREVEPAVADRWVLVAQDAAAAANREG